MSTLNEELKAAVALANDSYRAGMEQGYKLGFAAGHKAAIEAAIAIINRPLELEGESKPS